MNNELMIKRFEDINVFFMEDGWFNATSVARKFGKEPNDWLRQEDTFEYAVELAKFLNFLNPGLKSELKKIQLSNNQDQRRVLMLQFLKNCGLVYTRRGSSENGGGTWLHPDLAVVFARWCSPKFAVWCDKQIKEILLNNSGNREKVYARQDFPVFQNDALGFTQCMSAEDEYCKAHRVFFDTTIKEFCGLRNPVYIRQLTNLVFKIFTGFEVKDFRRGWGIMRGSRLRTRLFVDSNLRRAIDDVEVQVRTIIKDHEIADFDEIYTIVGDIAQSISGHCRAHRISLGRSIPINLRVVA